MSTIEQQIEALEFEREGYVTFDKPDRVADVDEQLAYWRGQLKDRGPDAPTEPLSPSAKKQTEAGSDGALTEAEAAKDPAADGEAARNAIAEAHAKQDPSGPDTSVITEAEAAEEDDGKLEAQSNALADKLHNEDQPNPADAAIVTEEEVIEQTKFDENGAPVEHTSFDADGVPVPPARNASAEEWRAFEKALPAPLNVPEGASRDDIIAAYVDSIAPSGNASGDTWEKYAKEHNIDTDGKSRDEIRAAAAEAGWAKADDRSDAKATTGKPKRNTADSTPRTTR